MYRNMKFGQTFCVCCFQYSEVGLHGWNLERIKVSRAGEFGKTLYVVLNAGFYLECMKTNLNCLKQERQHHIPIRERTFQMNCEYNGGGQEQMQGEQLGDKNYCISLILRHTFSHFIISEVWIHLPLVSCLRLTGSFYFLSQ